MKKQRIFVVSDLHGIREIYDSIIEDLEKKALMSEEEIVLYINGDVIDRGPNSIYILQDVIKRVKGKKGNITVKMLAGNHEMMMYEALVLKKNNKWPISCDWFYKNNGGQVTASQFDSLSVDEQQEIVDFIYNLPLYEVIDEDIFDNNGVILVHACTPYNIKDNNVKVIKDCINSRRAYRDVFRMLWMRENDLGINERIGMDDYFTIIGHTPVGNGYGFEYYKYDNVLNIDGGCAYYALVNSFDLKVPLVELDFNNKNLLIDCYDKYGKKCGKYIMDNYDIYECPSNVNDTTVSIDGGTINNKSGMSKKEKILLKNGLAIMGVIAIMGSSRILKDVKNYIGSQGDCLNVNDFMSIGNEVTIELTYKVKEDDSILEIANMYNVTVNDIVAYNSINLIYSGQVLLIPYIIDNNDLMRFVKIIKGEENIQFLANKYHTTAETIKKLNTIIRVNEGGIIVPNEEYIIDNYDIKRVFNNNSKVRLLTKKGYI